MFRKLQKNKDNAYLLSVFRNVLAAPFGMSPALLSRAWDDPFLAKSNNIQFRGN